MKWKVTLSVLIVGIMVINPSIYTSGRGEDIKKIRIDVPIESMKIVAENGNYVSIKMENVTYVHSPGKPVLPEITRVFELPFGVRVKNFDVKIHGMEEMDVNGVIEPSMGPLPMLPEDVETSLHIDKSIYRSTDFYPPEWYSYRVGCGMNEEGKRVTFLSFHLYPVRYAPAINKLQMIKGAEIKIEYTKPERTLPENSVYQLLVITPSALAEEAQRLVDHKNSIGVSAFMKTAEEIYDEYNGRDKPEKIKYFIKDAIEKWGIKYVLLFGGVKSPIWSKPRDNANAGEKDWYIPVRYTNLYDNPKYPLAETLHDPGVASDLYYADIYKEGGEFDDWDSNNDGIFAAWNKPGVDNDSLPDLYPDVAVGRLAITGIDEAKTVVDKIINYENNAYGEEWFKRMVVVSGDGFLDQMDLNIKWDTNGLPDGAYTIYAQSINDEGEKGPVDTTHITIDKSRKTKLTFSHDDYLNPALQNGYPAPPIAEIVSVSDGDVLGNTDYHYNPSDSEAYLNEFFHWANISYENGVLTIRGKSYDPKPYGNVTSIHVWIEDENGNIVFSDWRNDTEMYYEGEWTTGEKALKGRGGALYYMPEDFEKEILWTSNGKFTGQNDVINAFNNGCGFFFMSGHGSPNVWADHLPGVPGNRQHSSIVGLYVTTLRPWFPYFSFPLFPIDTLSNGEKLPVAVIGGCHNAQFNVSAIPAFLDAFHLLSPLFPNKYMWTYGQPVPECFCWRLVRNPHGGAIASMGNTGLGYGMPGKDCTTGGGDSWITIEFFRQYGERGQKVLGMAHSQAVATYVNTFDMNDMGAGHTKTVEQWVLLGDPSLMMGGYS